MSLDEMSAGPLPGAPRHRLVVGFSGGGWTSVEAQDPETGLALWCYEPRRLLNDLACADGTVFVSTRVWHRADVFEPARVVALRASDGTERWRVDPEHIRLRLAALRLLCGVRVACGQFSLTAARFATRSLRLAGTQNLLVDGEMLLVSNGSTLIAFDQRTGRLGWVSPVLSGRRRRLFSACYGRVYLDGEPQGVQALDTRTGKRLWTFNRSGVVQICAATATRVYVALDRGRRREIASLNAADGALVGTFLAQSGAERVLAVTDDGEALLLRDGRLTLARLDDERELWRGERLERDAQGDWRYSLTVSLDASERRLYWAYMRVAEGTAWPRVGAMRLDSGAALWGWEGARHPLPGRGGVFVTAALGNVYVSTGDGIEAFRGDGGTPLWRSPAGFLRVAGPAVVAVERA